MLGIFVPWPLNLLKPEWLTQLLYRVFIFNLVNSYKITHATHGVQYPNTYQDTVFTRSLSARHCSLALEIHRLMRCCNTQKIRLKSDANGGDERQYFSAMDDHLAWLKIEGTPYTSHVCSTCTHLSPSAYSDQGSSEHMIILSWFQCVLSEEISWFHCILSKEISCFHCVLSEEITRLIIYLMNLCQFYELWWLMVSQ